MDTFNINPFKMRRALSKEIDRSIPNPLEACMKSEVRHMMNYMLATLKPKERAIIASKFLTYKTYKQIGQDLEMSPTLVEMYYQKAIRKMRHPTYIRKMVELFQCSSSH